MFICTSCFKEKKYGKMDQLTGMYCTSCWKKREDKIKENLKSKQNKTPTLIGGALNNLTTRHG